MSLSFYKLLHILGIAGLLLALGSSLQTALLGIDKSDNAGHSSNAKLHGIALFLILVSGFGMLARLSITWPIPGWVVVKLVIWAFMGYALSFYKKGSSFSRIARWVIIALVGIAAYCSLYKPL